MKGKFLYPVALPEEKITKLQERISELEVETAQLKEATRFLLRTMNTAGQSENAVKAFKELWVLVNGKNTLRLQGSPLREAELEGT